MSGHEQLIEGLEQLAKRFSPNGGLTAEERRLLGLDRDLLILSEAVELLRDPGVYAIAVERCRQMSDEGWSADHDDAHSGREMALAAGCYALFSAASDAQRAATDLPASLSNTGAPLPGWAAFLSIWPWDRKWWKPKSPQRDLERSGALVAAEISRLLRRRRGAA